jgi:hypothetical protein
MNIAEEMAGTKASRRTQSNRVRRLMREAMWRPRGRTDRRRKGGNQRTGVAGARGAGAGEREALVLSGGKGDMRSFGRWEPAPRSASGIENVFPYIAPERGGVKTAG